MGSGDQCKGCGVMSNIGKALRPEFGTSESFNKCYVSLTHSPFQGNDMERMLWSAGGSAVHTVPNSRTE